MEIERAGVGWGDGRHIGAIDREGGGGYSIDREYGGGGGGGGGGKREGGGGGEAR